MCFAHANGFPAACYRMLLEPLSEHFRLGAPERFGHDPDYPVDNNWHGLTKELLAWLRHWADDQPVIGIGHSLGGILCYMAALREPRCFSRLILLDPPLMTGLDSLGLKLAKRLGSIDRITPAGMTRTRRRRWPDAASARDFFAGKTLFQNFHPQALDDYVQHGLRPTDGGLELVFDPLVEAAIFRTHADHLGLSRWRQRVPTIILYGSDSQLLNPNRIGRLRRRGFDCRPTPGGHLFPMEQPATTLSTLLGLLGSDMGKA